MCVIVVKPKGEDMPSMSTLFECWEQNPDGAGLMFNDGNNVRIEKGFMSWQAFERRIEKLVKHTDVESKTIVFHFRIATHGEVSRECCHPFPLTTNLNEIRRCKCVTNMGIAHNGIIQGRNTDKLKSDTMDYIMNVVAPMYAEMGDRFIESKHVRKVIENTINGSRMVFLKPNGEYYLIGSWSVDEGCFFSNLYHKSYRQWYNYNMYDDTDYESVNMTEPPSDMCKYLCDDYGFCVMAREWYCLNEDEAIETIEEYMMRDEMAFDIEKEN